MLIFTSFFVGVPYFGKMAWPHFLDFWEKHELSYTTVFLGVNIALHNIIHLGANLVYYFFYHYEFAVIERYKNNDNPWPWNEDPEAWRVLCRKSIILLLFNSNVIPFFVYIGLAKFNLLE
jgi:hypothetical protein